MELIKWYIGNIKLLQTYCLLQHFVTLYSTGLRIDKGFAGDALLSGTYMYIYDSCYDIVNIL